MSSLAVFQSIDDLPLSASPCISTMIDQLNKPFLFKGPSRIVIIFTRVHRVCWGGEGGSMAIGNLICFKFVVRLVTPSSASNVSKEGDCIIITYFVTF